MPSGVPQGVAAPRRGRSRGAHAASRAPAIEALEPRQLLSTINWINRGQFSDRFNSTFGADADLARSVVDAAIDAWERVITDFNRPGGGETINVNISMDSSGTGFGASAVVTSHTSGYPTAGSLTLDRGDDTDDDGRGDGDGYFLDPTPYDHSEFVGAIGHAFTGDAQSQSPAYGQSDLFTLVAHELTHILGLVAFSALRLHNPLAGSITDTGLADDSEGDGTGRYFVFDGPSVTHLMTSNNGGPGGLDAGRIIHSAGPDAGAPNQPVTFQSDYRGTRELVGTQDIINPVYEFGRRYLPTDYIALILHDAYGYSVTLPQTFGTFYATLIDSTGELLVRGRTSGDSDDTFTISRAGDSVRVSVDLGDDAPGSGPNGDDSDLPAYVADFPLAAITSITVQAGNGDDSLIIDFSGGDPLPPGGLVYSGSRGLGDSLTVDLAGTFGATRTGSTDGTVHITDTNETITYTSVETVQATGGSFAVHPTLVVEPAELNEGESVLLDLMFNPGEGEHTVTIDWGDGGVDVMPLPAGVAEIVGLSRTYADDVSSGTAQDPLTVAVTIEDAQQAVVFSDSATVTVHNIAPVVTSLSLNPSTVEAGGQATLSGTFDDPGSLDTHSLDVDGDGDGTYEVTGIPVSGRAFSVELVLGGPPGTHPVNVRLHDDDGGKDAKSTSVTIVEPATDLGNLQLLLGGIPGPGASPIIDEGGVLTLMGSFDASSAEHNVHIDWGDGSHESIQLTNFQYSFTTTHTYLDDAPSVTPQDTYLVTVQVEEDALGGDAIMNNLEGPADQVTIRNVAPFITSLALSPNPVGPGGQATLAGTFSDPGQLDTFQIDLDVDGDGAFEVTGMPVSGGVFSVDVAINAPPGTHAVNVRIHDDDGGMTTQSVSITVGELPSSVTGVHLFYNDSAFDGNGPAVDSRDIAAIAGDKTPLAPGGTASFANISGYDRGINGLFIDFDELPADGAAIDAGDFLFRVGNDDRPEAWPAGPAPTSVGVLANQGPSGADRVYITFADRAIAGTWLWTTVLAGGDTGLSFDEDFFFGAAPGETGAGFLPGTVGVDAADLQFIAQNVTPLNQAGTEPVVQAADVNRDGTVNAFDLQVVAVNLNFSALALITPLVGVPGSAVLAASVAPPVPLTLSYSAGPAVANDAKGGCEEAERDVCFASHGDIASYTGPRWTNATEDEGSSQQARLRGAWIRDSAIESWTAERFGIRRGLC